jgi:hypothetical protein
MLLKNAEHNQQYHYLHKHKHIFRSLHPIQRRILKIVTPGHVLNYAYLL